MKKSIDNIAKSILTQALLKTNKSSVKLKVGGVSMNFGKVDFASKKKILSEHLRYTIGLNQGRNRFGI